LRWHAGTAACQAGELAQQWNLDSRGLIGSSANFCLGVLGGSLLDGGAIGTESCFVPGDQWIPTPNGELVNTNSGRCLADPGDGPPGTRLVQEDCYGQAAEIWAAS
jgi:Ricin-type beta-trefoil lectin domain